MDRTIYNTFITKRRAVAQRRAGLMRLYTELSLIPDATFPEKADTLEKISSAISLLSAVEKNLWYSTLD